MSRATGTAVLLTRSRYEDVFVSLTVCFPMWSRHCWLRWIVVRHHTSAVHPRSVSTQPALTRQWQMVAAQRSRTCVCAPWPASAAAHETRPDRPASYDMTD